VKEGLKIFGPTAAAAKLEGSKAFAKEFMVEAGIPTAKFGIFVDAGEARRYISSQDVPLVIKADGLAAGKGVVVCDDSQQALAAIESITVRKEFGAAGDRVVIEERLDGEEASFIAMCDGETIVPLASSQDHKRVFDGDKGPNTGGMGAYSPAPVVDAGLYEQIVKQVMNPAISTMKKRGTPFIGFLYAGIMVDKKSGRPYVLEFNARMGDPECQPIMMRMKSDLFQVIDAAVHGRLDRIAPIEWSDQASVCVVMASKGYPGRYETGQVIEGLDSSSSNRDVMVFHAGTARDSQGRVLTNGGRVLGVTALGSDAEQAAARAYSTVSQIRWGVRGENGHQYRSDIARRAIMRHRK
jgi:phosphoribosylamine--glycine ligase